MIPTAHSRTEKWRNVVGEGAMQAVDEVVSPVISAPFSPGPPIAGMEKIVAAALDRLGVAHAGIVTVSASSPEPFIADLPDEARKFFAIRPKEALARAISWRMTERLDETIDSLLRAPLENVLGADVSTRLRGRTWLELVRLPSKDGRNRNGELGLMTLHVRCAAAVYCAGFAAAGVAGRLPPLRTVLELIRLGNVPLGTLETGQFLILVE